MTKMTKTELITAGLEKLGEADITDLKEDSLEALRELAKNEKPVAEALKLIKSKDREISVMQNEVLDAAAYIHHLEDELFRMGRMERAPCFFCGYDGRDYFNETRHRCAKKHYELAVKEGIR